MRQAHPIQICSLKRTGAENCVNAQDSGLFDILSWSTDFVKHFAGPFHRSFDGVETLKNDAMKNITITSQGNLALIDFSNIFKVFRDFTWRLCFKKYRKWLKEEFGVSEAVVFLGSKSSNRRLGQLLRNAGFKIIYLPVANTNSHVKGGVDVNLAVYGMKHCTGFDKVVLCSGDGDFLPLVRHFVSHEKLKAVICASFDALSGQLFYTKKSVIVSMEHLAPILAKESNPSNNSRKAS